MLQQAFSLSFLILSLIMLSIILVCTANSNIYVQCSQLNFTSMTPYESNVNSLFTSLDDSSSLYNFNKFETSQPSDGVYGLFQCRGDLSSTNCKDCVANAISQLKTTCPVSIGGEIQLEGCFVKYDDTSFFGAEDKMEVCRRCGPSVGYNSDVLSRIDSALAHLVGGNGQYFREGDFGSIQGVAQCVQDLSLSDCQDCLSEASGRLRSECEISTWGDMYLGKCYIRYAEQGNLNSGNDNGNSTPNKRKGKARKIKITTLIWTNILSLIGGAGASIALTCVCKNNCNKYVYNYNQMSNLKRDLKVAKKETETAKADKAKIMEKIGEQEKLKCESIKYVPCIPPMPMPIPIPPPCPYMPHSSANSCYYL